MVEIAERRRATPGLIDGAYRGNVCILAPLGFDTQRPLAAHHTLLPSVRASSSERKPLHPFPLPGLAKQLSKPGRKLALYLRVFRLRVDASVGDLVG